MRKRSYRKVVKAYDRLTEAMQAAGILPDEFPPGIHKRFSVREKEKEEEQKKNLLLPPGVSPPPPDKSQPPGTTSWPTDVAILAVAFARKKGRDPLPSEKARWIKDLRTKFLPLDVTPIELDKAYDQCIAKGIEVKTPASIFFKVDSIRTKSTRGPETIGQTQDGATLVQYADGTVGRIYGED